MPGCMGSDARNKAGEGWEQSHRGVGGYDGNRFARILHRDTPFFCQPYQNHHGSLLSLIRVDDNSAHEGTCSKAFSLQLHLCSLPLCRKAIDLLRATSLL